MKEPEAEILVPDELLLEGPTTAELSITQQSASDIENAYQAINKVRAHVKPIIDLNSAFYEPSGSVFVDSYTDIIQGVRTVEGDKNGEQYSEWLDFGIQDEPDIPSAPQVQEKNPPDRLVQVAGGLGDNGVMSNAANPNRPYSEFKHDLIQIVATALAIAALTIPLLQWGIDSKLQAVDSKVEALNAKMDARFDQLTTKIEAMNENMKTRQEMYERVIDERTSKK